MNYLLYVTAFIIGMVGMVIELAGSRLLAPYLGTSIFVWTNLIGIVLASLSVGYYLGGTISKDGAKVRTLADILSFSIFFSALILFLEKLIPFLLNYGNVPIVAFIGSLILFTPITITLGMVTPYVARLKINTLDQIGSSVGTLYSVSTIGSIIGTFLGGIILISFLGTRIIFILITFTLVLLYLAVTIISKEKIFTLKFLLSLIAIILMISSYLLIAHADSTILVDKDTPYNRWLIYQATSTETGHPVRLLVNGIGGVQSGVDMSTPNKLLFKYTQLFDYAELVNPSIKQALLIGAAGFTYPMHYTTAFPDRTMDVVEIDPDVEDLAEQYLLYKKDPRIKVFNEDGRIFLNTNQKKYDVIYLDAFSSNISIPFQLTTIEMVNKLKETLTENGVVVANIVSASDGPLANFMKAEYKTYKEVFPHVVIARVNPVLFKDRIDNFMLIASANPHQDLSSIPNQLDPKTLESTLPVLTDNFAPVELYSLNNY